MTGLVLPCLKSHQSWVPKTFKPGQKQHLHVCRSFLASDHTRSQNMKKLDIFSFPFSSDFIFGYSKYKNQSIKNQITTLFKFF